MTLPRLLLFLLLGAALWGLIIAFTVFVIVRTA